MALSPVALVIGWLFFNTHVFSPVVTPRNWVSKGIYGEKSWFLNRSRVPERYGRCSDGSFLLGIIGFALLAWDLVKLLIVPTAFGALLLVLAQLCRACYTRNGSMSAASVTIERVRIQLSLV